MDTPFFSIGERWLLVLVILRWAAKCVVTSESSQACQAGVVSPPSMEIPVAAPICEWWHVCALGASLCLRRFISIMSSTCCGRFSPNKFSVIGVEAEQMCLNYWDHQLGTLCWHAILSGLVLWWLGCLLRCFFPCTLTQHCCQVLSDGTGNSLSFRSLGLSASSMLCFFWLNELAIFHSICARTGSQCTAILAVTILVLSVQTQNTVTI